MMRRRCQPRHPRPIAFRRASAVSLLIAAVLAAVPLLAQPAGWALAATTRQTILVGMATNGSAVGTFNGNPLASSATWLPFSTFTGGSRVALGDVNGDGVPDAIVGPGPGGPALVRVYDGTSLESPSQTLLTTFSPFDPGFTGGVFV